MAQRVACCAILAAALCPLVSAFLQHVTLLQRFPSIIVASSSSSSLSSSSVANERRGDSFSSSNVRGPPTQYSPISSSSSSSSSSSFSSPSSSSNRSSGDDSLAAFLRDLTRHPLPTPPRTRRALIGGALSMPASCTFLLRYPTPPAIAATSSDGGTAIAASSSPSSSPTPPRPKPAKPAPAPAPAPAPTSTSTSTSPSSTKIQYAAQNLWDLDSNRLTPGIDYEIDLQGGKKPYGKPPDAAPGPLFRRVDPIVFERRPTYRTFAALLDNYMSELNETEVVTSEEKAETSAFLDAIMSTDPMRFCHAFCHAERPDTVPDDPAEFASLLRRIWFGLYRRTKGGAIDSSGFEHVFVGETRDSEGGGNFNREVIGFHNWIRFYLEERRGALDYRGYIKPKNDYDVAADNHDQVLTLQFLWNGAEKMVGTSFVGVSPEFEMALYTTCFLVGQQQNFVQLKTCTDTFELNVKCFPIAKGKIGSSFVEELGHGAGQGACPATTSTKV